MWSIETELKNHRAALVNARRVHAETAEFIKRIRAEKRTPTLTGVAPQAGGPRAWAPHVAAGLAPRPSARGSER